MVDPYLDVVGELLAGPSAEKRLQDIASRPDWTPDPALQKPVDSARRWCDAVLRPQFRPKASARFVGFRREEGLCDTVRCEYESGPYRLHVAQTVYVICIDVRFSGPVNRAQAPQVAERVAGEILNAGPGMRFRLDGEFGGGVWGRRELAESEMSDPEWPSWSELLRWWCVGDRISFVTLKTEGGPTREVIVPAASFNASWFR